MIKNNKIIKNLVLGSLKEEFKSYKWILFIIIFFVLNLISKVDSYDIAFKKGGDFTWWDVLYNFIQNQYYVMGVFIPMIIYAVFKSINGDISSEYIIRHGDRKNFIISRILTSSIIIFMFILLSICISIIGSIGLDFSPRWSTISMEIYSKDIVNMFSSPIIPIIISIILLSTSLIFIANIIILSTLFLNNKFVYIPVIFIWVSSLVGFRVVGSKKLYEYVFINTHMLLHQSLDISNKGIFISLFAMIFLSLICAFISLKKINSFDFLSKVEI